MAVVDVAFTLTAIQNPDQRPTLGLTAGKPRKP